MSLTAYPSIIQTPSRPQSCPLNLRPQPTWFMERSTPVPTCPSSDSLPDLRTPSPTFSNEDVELPPTESALLLAFDPENPGLTLDAVLGDPPLRDLVRAATTTVPFSPATVSMEDIITRRDTAGRMVYQPRRVLTTRYHQGLKAMANFVHAGLNNYDRWAQMDTAVPPYVPESSLNELRLPMTTLSLVLGSEFTALFELAEFDTAEEALAHLKLLRRLSCHFALWSIYAIVISAENALAHGGSCINFGAAIGMSAGEFLNRLAPTFIVGGYHALREYIADKEMMDEMDFKFVRLLYPGCDSFLIGTHDSHTYVSTWPTPAPAVPAAKHHSGWRPSIVSAARQMVRRRLRELHLADVWDEMAKMAI